MLSSVGLGSSDFSLHFVFFPAALFVSGEGFSVVAAVTWIMATMRGIVNLLAHPSLPRRDRRVAIVALSTAMHHASSLDLHPSKSQCNRRASGSRIVVSTFCLRSSGSDLAGQTQRVSIC
jgi:hypothetical protein